MLRVNNQDKVIEKFYLEKDMKLKLKKYVAKN